MTNGLENKHKNKDYITQIEIDLDLCETMRCHCVLLSLFDRLFRLLIKAKVQSSVKCKNVELFNLCNKTLVKCNSTSSSRIIFFVHYNVGLTTI